MGNQIKPLFIIDHFEEDWAVIEYGEQIFNVPRAAIPAEAQEGDVLDFGILVNQAATEQRKREVEALVKDLFVEEKE
ncbi:DUF3006 domain-containing protein [Brevibacillus dissolubilis]|uniref:DUF3006 domain-containing protein n=1 Tax=Brevibacillus dissolubilis TaxID=1844116 RepID=UPI001116A9E9|nr:DUF3006 domain-containing protein [Brevibacillus dissolubilis]